MSMVRSAESAGGRRRQERGQRRAASLLVAAGNVFEEFGYERATTNSIAARAGVSVGTLYQFFSNKQEIAEALAEKYAKENEAVFDSAFRFDAAGASLPEMIRAIVDPVLDFRQHAPGFDTLFLGSAVSEELSVRARALDLGLEHRICGLMLSRCPYMRGNIVEATAKVCVHIVKGTMPLALKGDPEARAFGAEQIKIVLERYLRPIIEMERVLAARESPR